jgi:hypothetical protein
MRRPKTKEDKALDEALDVLIAKSGHSPEAIMGDKGLLAQLINAMLKQPNCAFGPPLIPDLLWKGVGGAPDDEVDGGFLIAVRQVALGLGHVRLGIEEREGHGSGPHSPLRGSWNGRCGESCGVIEPI